jgi:hypothetical protein
VPEALFVFDVCHVTLHVCLEAFGVPKEMLFGECLMVHTNVCESCEASFETQCLERAILESSGREELPEVVLFTKDQAEELSCGLYLFDLGRLHVVVKVFGLICAELPLEVDFGVRINEVLDDRWSEELYRNVETVCAIGCSSGVPDYYRSAGIALGARFSEPWFVEECVEDGGLAHSCDVGSTMSEKGSLGVCAFDLLTGRTEEENLLGWAKHNMP